MYRDEEHRPILGEERVCYYTNIELNVWDRLNWWQKVLIEMNWRNYIETWKIGGCLVCGKANRDNLPFAHIKCWELQLTQADRNDIYVELRKAS